MDKKNTRQEVYNLIAQGKDKRDIANILNLSLRSVERYIKEFNDITTATKESDKIATKTSDRKKRKTVARSLIISGESLKDVAEKIGTPKSTIANWSSKENLQQSQLEFLKSLRDEKLKEIKANKLKRFDTNSLYLEELQGKELNKQTQELILLNEKTEQEIFEVGRMERLERLELDKINNRNKQLELITSGLNNLSDKDIVDILEIIKSKESKEGINE